jgi:hypothetical protein
MMTWFREKPVMIMYKAMVLFRVELVMISGDGKNRSFALKQMKKSQIVETRQQQHIMSEKVNFCFLRPIFGPLTFPFNFIYI